ncbi:lecithin retinol acyltransferase family protein [Acinetobacter baumannii]
MHHATEEKVVVRRMRSRMHENHYHLIINNCEHFMQLGDYWYRK